MELARTFLYDNPGKWTASCNEKFWPMGTTLDHSGKIEWVKGKAQIGFDCIGTDIIFTKRPCLKPSPDWVIIQTHFDSPIVRFEEHVDSYIKGSTLFADDPQRYSNMISVLSDDESLDDVSRDIRYVTSHQVVISKRFCDPLDLAPLHNVKQVVVAKSLLWDKMPTIFQCQSIMEALSMVRTAVGKRSAVDIEWIGRHAIVNAFAIPRTMELLEAMHCVRPMVVDNSTVVIQKKAPCPATIEFGKIPEGTFSLEVIKKMLGEDALKFLKSYEGNGLIFGFNDQKKTFYLPKKAADREAYNNATGTLIDQTQRWSQIVDNAKWLNNILHESVRRLYNSHEVYMADDSMKKVERIGEVVNISI